MVSSNRIQETRKEEAVVEFMQVCIGWVAGKRDPGC